MTWLAGNLGSEVPYSTDDPSSLELIGSLSVQLWGISNTPLNSPILLAKVCGGISKLGSTGTHKQEPCDKQVI